MNIKEAITFAQNFLGSSKTALIDAEALIAFVLGVEKEYLFTHGDEEFEDFLEDLLQKYLERLKVGEPLAYITGEKEFYGIDFFVDKRVLVPRPETEELVKFVCDFLSEVYKRGGSKFRLLDVGTGSLNIPIAIARQFEGLEPEVISQIDAIDISDEALDVAKINLEQHSLVEKINLIQSDLLDEIEDGEKYDVITANLPYIATDEDKKFVDENVQMFEPGLALFAGNDGLDLYRKMFEQLCSKGVSFSLFIGEFGFGQTKALEQLLDEFFEDRWSIVKDMAGIDRFFVVKALLK